MVPKIKKLPEEGGHLAAGLDLSTIRTIPVLEYAILNKA